MRSGNKIVAALLALGVMALLVVGCGSGDSSSPPLSTASDTTAEPGAAGSPDRSSEVARNGEFIRPGGQNEIAQFGEEAAAVERDAASAVLEESLNARARGDWATQCSTLSAKAIEEVEEFSKVKEGCEKNLAALAQPLTESQPRRASTMIEPVAALRVQGNEGFALYHGKDATDYGIAMAKEGGEWKVGAIEEEELP
jgi:hypothetical protein